MTVRTGISDSRLARARLHFDEARRLRRAGDDESALERCRAGLKAEPGSLDLVHLEAGIFKSRGAYEDEWLAVRRGLRRHPRDTGLWCAGGSALAHLRNHALAARYFSRAAQADPRCANAWIGLASMEEARGRRDRAARLYERALALDPRSGALLSKLGRLSLLLGRPRKTLAYSRRLLRLQADKKSEASALQWIGAARILSGAYRRGIADLDKSLRLGEPAGRMHDETLIWRAHALRRLGRPAEARADLERLTSSGGLDCLGLRVTQTLLHSLIGRGIDEELFVTSYNEPWLPGRPTRSSPAAVRRRLEVVFKSLKGDMLARCPTNKNRMFSLGQRLSIPLLYRGAEWVIRSFEPWLRRFPDEPQLYSFRGEVRLWSGDYAGARADMQRAVQFNRKGRRYVPWAYVGLMASCAAAGNYREALRWRDDILQKSSWQPPTFFIWQGELLRRMGDAVGAAASLEEAMRRAPDRVAVRINLALVRYDQGRGGPARELFDQIKKEAPNLLLDALAAFDDVEVSDGASPAFLRELLLKSLALMRGNRSHRAFYWDIRQRMRCVEPA